MNTHCRHRSGRLIAVLACLALYLAGSNWCLINARGGSTTMACMATPLRSMAASTAPPCHAADHAAKPRGGRSSGTSTRCCPQPVVVPAGGSQLEPAVWDETGTQMAVALPTSTRGGGSVGSSGLVIALDAEAPPGIAAAPSQARAPPLV